MKIPEKKAANCAVWGGLTQAQQNVVRLASHGMSDEEIAAESGTTVSAVRKHLEKARTKLGLFGMSPRALIAWYFLHGPGKREEGAA